MPKTYQMKDLSDSFTIKKKDIPSLPMRMVVIGRTGCGKSSLALGNFLLRPEFYLNDFKNYNIFIFSGSLKGDLKMQTIVKCLDVPSVNLFDSFDEDIAHAIYDMLVDNFNEAIEEKRKPEHSIFIFDDLGFSNLQNKNNKNSILDKIFSNGRKFLISTITLNQRVTQLSSNAREQASVLVLFSSSNMQLELIEKQFNYLSSKKQFMNMIKKYTGDSVHDYIIMDLGKKNIYRNMEFKAICTCSDGTNECGNYQKK